MKSLLPAFGLTTLMVVMVACGGTDKETTVVRERPIIVHTGGVDADDVEANCPNGYSNRTRSCY